MPTDAPSAASASARFTAVVLLPTPPLPDATAMMFFTFGSSFTPRWTACATTCEVTVDLYAGHARHAGDGVRHKRADGVELAFRRITQHDVHA